MDATKTYYLPASWSIINYLIYGIADNFSPANESSWSAESADFYSPAFMLERNVKHDIEGDPLIRRRIPASRYHV